VKREEEVKTMTLTFAIELEQIWRGWCSVGKCKIEWHTKSNARIIRQIFKLHILSLGSTIVTPKRLISF
jgi:hypothetical protein